MAEEGQAAEGGAEEAAAPAPKSKFKLIVIAVALLLVASGGGVWFFLMRGHGHGEAKTAEAALPKPPVFLDVPEMMVNLAGQPGDRIQYLKVKVALEVKDQPIVAQITPAMPRVVDIFQTYLRELRAVDLNGSAGMFRMKEELTRRVNVVVAPAQVSAVLFKEVVIQ